MQKKTQNLRGGMAAAAVICSLAIFGCTTNHTPGDGQPSTTPPMTPAATPGTSSGTNPPMASAMDLSNKVERSVEAQAIMAAHQRERFLGYINPTGPQPNPPDASQVVPPSQYVTPIATVNASISSPGGTPVITSGAGGDGTLNFVAAPVTVTAANSASLATPTTAAMNVTPGQFAAGPTATTGTTPAIASTPALTPTLSSSTTPSPTRAANSPLTTAGTTAASTATQTSSATTPSGTGRLVLNGSTIASGSVRAVTNSTGAITVTNVPVVIKGK